MEKIIEIKAEIFDIIWKQEMLKNEFQKLEKLKQEKLKELNEYEKNNTSN